jgi:hypothetical protein
MRSATGWQAEEIEGNHGMGILYRLPPNHGPMSCTKVMKGNT